MGHTRETIECPACEAFSCKQEATFQRHLMDIHGVELRSFWDALHGGPGLCRCGCGGETTWLGWRKGYSTVLTGHNANLRAVYGEEHAAKIIEKRATALRGRMGWSKGRTKETDPRVAARAAATSAGRKRAFDEGRIVIWSKGRTKETDPRVAAMATAFREAYASGIRRPWAEGHTKETDPRVAAMASKVSLMHQLKSIRTHLDGLKRRSIDDVRMLIESTGELVVVGGLESYTNECKSLIEVECPVCKTRAKTIARYLYGGRCRACHPMGSLDQLEIFDFVRSLANDAVSCDRTTISPQELDIWVPSAKFGVEFNGLYWHSDLNRSSFYHANKTKAATHAGISLLHVFEDDWAERRPIVESLIRHRMGMTQRRVHARRCVLVELSPKERRTFFEANHLDGDVAALIAFGLRLDGELVMALSLRKSFHRSHSERLEIARSCPVVNATVRGGLSRLICRALTECRASGKIGLITYVDRRIGDGAGYIAAGMKKTGETPPRFWWTDFRRRFNRFKFKANSAEGLTEREVAGQAGVVKIWGCPNAVLTIDA